jgi:hypothetical protein
MSSPHPRSTRRTCWWNWSECCGESASAAANVTAFRPGFPALAVGACLLLAGCDVNWEGRALPDDPYGWNGAGKVVTQAAINADRELQRGQAEATRGAVYFGAFHVDRATSRYAYARNWNSLEAAISVSAAVCASAAGRRCVLAAFVLPDGMPPDTRGAGILRSGADRGGRAVDRASELPRETSGGIGASRPGRRIRGAARRLRPLRGGACHTTLTDLAPLESVSIVDLALRGSISRLTRQDAAFWICS